MPAEGWEAVIGMEVHVQVSTKSKMFCGCSSDYLAKPPNANVCPVCLGMPGVLPVINKRAVEQVVKSAVALGCEVAPFTKFDRKNYFYPDLPKGYQISQYDLPLSRHGELQVNGRTVRITRAHLEEDTGKLVHAGDQLHSAGESFVDLNRAGLPLMEIVSEPDIRSASEAREYAQALRTLLRYIGASEADMEKGQLRAEANVSVRRAGEEKLGVKTELKNINSFRALQRAIEHEVERQIGVLEGGGEVVQETRGWSETEQRTFSQRSKEYAQDYRYFPEPDLPPLELSREWIDQIRAALPELPHARAVRFEQQYRLAVNDARLLTADPVVADDFEQAVTDGADARQVANWLLGEVLPRRRERTAESEADASRVSGAKLAKLVKLVTGGAINRDQGRQVLDAMLESGGDPDEIVRARGFSQISDTSRLDEIVESVIAANPKAVVDYRSGKQQALQALIGQVMRETRGSANAALVREILVGRLGG